MNVSSTPFIRNDYWPDYNDINQLNQRIDEAENEISLVNIHLSADIENVSNNLNTYANEQANTTVANNAIVNNLNANYAEGRFANFDNTFTNNAYIENLTVNKPVFDITLNTPHLENTTSLGGNFYNANLIDVNLSGDISGNLNDIGINTLLANTATIPNLFVDISAAPVTSSAVLGFDEQGRVIPVHATFDPSFPGDADYLWTDSTGTARKGVKATEIGAVENLITAYGVKNAIDALNAEVVDNFNLVTNALNDIDDWQNSFENSVANSFRNVNNAFNDVNNFVNDSFNDVNDSFNAVNNSFNDMSNNLDVLNNNISETNNTLRDLIENYLTVNTSGFINSTSPMNIKSVANVKVVKFGSAEPGVTSAQRQFKEYKISTITTNRDKYILSSKDTSPALNVYGAFNGSFTLKDTGSGNFITATFADIFTIRTANGLEFVGSGMQNRQGEYEFVNSATGIYIYVTIQETSKTDTVSIVTTDIGNGASMKLDVTNLSIYIPGAFWLKENCSEMFYDCWGLNSNVDIPNSAINCARMFANCFSLNQNIFIPPSVTNCAYMFGGCPNLNQNIYIYSENITDMNGMFEANPWESVKRKQIHLRSSIPLATSNAIYNSLVNGYTGLIFTGSEITNELEEPTAWPPV